MYGKIFDSMYEGTLYGHWEAIATLQQMLVLCNKDGVVEMTPQAIAARTSFPLDIIQKGIKVLEEPDPYSRTPGEEGRRIVLLDPSRPWGWRLVNYAKYQQIKNRQEKLEADRVRIADKRKANKSKDVAESRKTSQSVADVAPVTVTASGTGTTALKVKSDAASRPLATRLQSDWKIPAPWVTWARTERPAAALSEIMRIADTFRDHWIAKPGKDGTKLDWEATWRNWVRKEGTFGNGKTAPFADGKITCESCGTRASSYTGRQCDPCWRKGVPRRVAI